MKIVLGDQNPVPSPMVLSMLGSRLPLRFEPGGHRIGLWA
jgi:hypothetical protein